MHAGNGIHAGIGQRRRAGGVPAVALALSIALHAALLIAPRAPAPAPVEAPAGLAVRLLPAPVATPMRTAATATPRSRSTRAAGIAPSALHTTAAARASASPLAPADAEDGGGDLNYRRFYDENPNHPMRCMVGHVAQSSGDHASAVHIYEDCAKRGDNFSLLSLAVYYEVGAGGLARDPAKAAEIFHRIATGAAEAYAANGMFYYGLALYYGLGVARDADGGLEWLARASERGDRDAGEFIALAQAGTVPDAARYFRR